MRSRWAGAIRAVAALLLVIMLATLYSLGQRSACDSMSAMDAAADLSGGLGELDPGSSADYRLYVGSGRDADVFLDSDTVRRMPDAAEHIANAVLAGDAAFELRSYEDVGQYEPLLEDAPDVASLIDRVPELASLVASGQGATTVDNRDSAAVKAIVAYAQGELSAVYGSLKR